MHLSLGVPTMNDVTRITCLLLLSFAIVLITYPLERGTPAVLEPSSTCGYDSKGLDSRKSRSLAPSSPLAPGACRVLLKGDTPIPDPKCTPGAINPTITIEMIQDGTFSTKCVRSQGTSAAEKASMYEFYGISRPLQNYGETQSCELDHLVPLDLGGADTLDNIWPQCGPPSVPLTQRYFKLKDMVEIYLLKQVRDGKISLSDAQRGIAGDWTQYLPAARQPGGT
jgi:hypothetical protein